MTTLSEISFHGESGKLYDFKTFFMDSDFKPFGCVYIVTRRHAVEGGVSAGQTAFYVGQTDDLKKEMENHPQQECFVENGVNCICVHHDDLEQSRLQKVDDLIRKLGPKCHG